MHTYIYTLFWRLLGPCLDSAVRSAQLGSCTGSRGKLSRSLGTGSGASFSGKYWFNPFWLKVKFG